MTPETTNTVGRLEELSVAVSEAMARLRPVLAPTPLRRSLWLSEELEADVWLKCENLQPTGSFKVRGALNRLLCAAEASAQEGDGHVVAASTGNHGAAVSYAARKLAGPKGDGTPVRCSVFVPHETASAKLSTMRRLGAEIRMVGSDSLECEVAAREFAKAESALYVSPYNDPHVVAGQGTAGVEIDQQLVAAGQEKAEVVVASLGGGGLISGLSAGLRLGRGTSDDAPRVIAVSPDHSKVMHESVRAGRILDLPSLPTLSDGTAGGVEPGAVTFEWIQSGVDQFAVVGEDEIASALYACVSEERLLVEGAAALAIAGACAPGMREQLRGRRVVIVLCGANIPPDKLAKVLAEKALEKTD